MNFNEFCLYFFKELCVTADENEIDENVFPSPSSASLALSMLLLGSSKTTKEVLKDALGFVENKDALDRLSRVSDVLNSNSGSMQFEFDNSIFPSKSFYRVISKYILEVKAAYKCKRHKINFNKRTGIFERAISNWVKRCGKIKHLSINMDPKTACVLASSLNFKFGWLDALNPYFTTYNAFYCTEDKTSNV